MAETLQEYQSSKEVYQAKLQEFESKISKINQQMNTDYRTEYLSKISHEVVLRNGGRGCKGGGGMSNSGCRDTLRWIDAGIAKWKSLEQQHKSSIANIETERDEYILSVREEEKQKQITAIQDAIQEQFKIEEERISREIEAERISKIEEIQNKHVSPVNEVPPVKLLTNTTIGLSPFIIGGILLFFMSRKKEVKK
tara:strand:- start:7074 stop:7661 length:588 start_codon:yes stop_codon:yes gene_type:complete